ncbi:NADH-quinone oxidoreductase subunit NuoK [Meiothermus taiwanensis]|jgi:NADH-quinone oxidoreductase subunit K|uniref:NADH-quinone oxidoreductase subunit K n=2 Tax=Meiothermus taiwanensis TaxID=172827 RepID=A0A399E0C2_9DEIN|nr:NADH-quinone oxidoreductase subunit NuoK [Meiothermus taiwanensis]AWR86346.1 NADH-quinone oxidoreductase, K subunit [Meiothermus taiwanensis WR-220]KIQ54449.1 NADH:ubiquinone oxidoreductase subunit K [Meiothermus taiwanensis]KZK15911.1 NADH-quinone oxidoreductase subunit K [Meiothermus taiwanensis]RIH77935.1 NADH-quinone oxidoreductase subunit 11 [Meiothermus taiwanensis]
MIWLVASALLFSIGAYGALTRRTAILMFLSIELMLNAAALSLVSFSKLTGSLEAQVVVLFIIAIAAAEVAVGLGLIVAIFRRRETTGVDELRQLRG